MTFKEIIKQSDGDRVITESCCEPGAGPVKHVHYMQDESLTVDKGKMGCQIFGEEPVFYTAGQTATFLRNVPHRFWNSGKEELVISGWIKPANSIIFFLSVLFSAQKKSGNGRPEAFDAAFIFTRYKNEYDLPDIPPFEKNVITPITYFIGQLPGKYKKFDGAPEPLK